MNSLVLLFGFLTQFQGNGPSISTAVDRQEVTVGDRITVTITVDHDSTTSVEWPSPTRLGSFDVLETNALPPVGEAGRIRSATAFTVTAFEVGDLTVPSVGVVVRRGGAVSGGAVSGGADDATVTLASDSIPVRVVSVGVEDARDIRDIKPPLSIPRNWLVLALIAVTTIVVIVAAVWAYRRRRRRALPPAAIEPMMSPRAAHEWALEALDRLEEARLAERGEIQRHYSEAAEIIRTYLERRFGIVAMEMISADIIEELEARLEDITVNRFREFFRDADLVKFAKYRPTLDACRTVVPAARILVDTTKMLVEPTPRGSEIDVGSDSPATVPSPPVRHGSSGT